MRCQTCLQVKDSELRDKLAAAALTGLLAAETDAFGYESSTGYVKRAYELADAMLEARRA